MDKIWIWIWILIGIIFIAIIFFSFALAKISGNCTRQEEKEAIKQMLKEREGKNV